VQAILLEINATAPPSRNGALTVGGLIHRYEQEEMPSRYSTKASYSSLLNQHIRQRWADTRLAEVRPMIVEQWINRLELAPKTKSHIKSLRHSIFDCGQRWQLITGNPIDLVRVKNGSKRRVKPRILTIPECRSLLSYLPEPYRTMVLIAGCLGLRASEIVGLQWDDFDFDGLTLLVQRSVVHGRSGDTKTESS
jgi:integrase